jgi:hypothetical protein
VVSVRVVDGMVPIGTSTYLVDNSTDHADTTSAIREALAHSLRPVGRQHFEAAGVSQAHSTRWCYRVVDALVQRMVLGRIG